MKPALLTIGTFSISSIGFFLVVAALVSLYVIWRIVRVYDLDEEKSIDLVILTIAAGFIFSRMYFILFHPGQFNDLLKIILVNRYPGFSFWGAFFGGLLVFRLLCARFKLNFWQMSDLVAPGFFLGISIASLGCLLGSCDYGFTTNIPIAVTQAGLIGKRFPVQLIQSLLFFLGFLYLWKGALRFHPFGSITAESLILLGIFKFLLEFFYDNTQKFGFLPAGHLYSLILVLFAVRVYYFAHKRTPFADFKKLSKVLSSGHKRQEAVLKLGKTWYNFKTDAKIAIGKKRKSLLRFLNIRSNPPEFKT